MKVTIWKFLRLGFTDACLPASIIADIKKNMSEEIHALKYIVFRLDALRSSDKQDSFLNEALQILDLAKQYNLTKGEFEAACIGFVSPQLQAQKHLQRNTSLNNRLFYTKRQKVYLPIPKAGQVLWRKDKRRPGACKVVKVDDLRTTVQWTNTGRHTSILNKNIQDPFLFSHKQI
jgi:hypothetical protein